MTAVVKAKLLSFFGRVKKTTLFYIGVLIAGSATVQITWVQHHVIPLLANHPHFSTLGGALIIGISLIHNPVFLQIIQSLEEQQSETQPDGTVKNISVSTETLAPTEPTPPGA